MGKTKRGEKERSRERQLAHENQKLRREISSLRKQLARIDLDRHDYVKNIVEEHYAKEEVEDNTHKMLESMKNHWKCHMCKSGHLEINLYTRLDGVFYYRKCNECDNRTKSQQYNESVTGIHKQPLPVTKKA